LIHLISLCFVNLCVPLTIVRGLAVPPCAHVWRSYFIKLLQVPLSKILRALFIHMCATTIVRGLAVPPCAPVWRSYFIKLLQVPLSNPAGPLYTHVRHHYSEGDWLFPPCAPVWQSYFIKFVQCKRHYYWTKKII